MKNTITKIVVQNDIRLFNVQNSELDTMTFLKDTQLNMFIKEFEDGRVYRTIFKIAGTKIYMKTNMQFMDSAPVCNCGNIAATAKEIKRLVAENPIAKVSEVPAKAPAKAIDVLKEINADFQVWDLLPGQVQEKIYLIIK
jgi:hypothetical protein